MSQLMFWNKQNNNSNNNNNNNNNNSISNSNNATTNGEGKNGKRNWLHTPHALVNGHIAYLVKFFGHLPVEQAKGIDVVKDAIRKLQFAQQMKKAETGTQEKFKKVEITISVDGVAVQEPRTQNILHQFPLHNISYCADEKGVKKFFSFIAKTVKPHPTNGNNTNGMSNGTGLQISNNADETHECFIFISNKLASDITLTIGQAFDLAYKKFINSAEKTDLGKSQQRIAELEKNVNIYKNRLRELSLKVSKSDLDKFLLKMSIKDIVDIPKSEAALENGNNQLDEDKLLIDTNSTKSSNSVSAFAPIVPPRNNVSSQNLSKSNSQKLEELLLNSDSDSDFDPRADESFDNANKTNESGNSNISGDIFGFEPSKSYGQQLFLNNNDNKLLNNNSNNNYNNNNNNNTTISSNSFTNELHVRPPLLAPPPKVAAPRRSISQTSTIATANSSAIHKTNGNTDLFGSDPFDISTSSNNFKNKLSSISVDDFSLESLDPLKK